MEKPPFKRFFPMQKATLDGIYDSYLLNDGEYPLIIFTGQKHDRKRHGLKPHQHGLAIPLRFIAGRLCGEFVPVAAVQIPEDAGFLDRQNVDSSPTRTAPGGIAGRP